MRFGGRSGSPTCPRACSRTPRRTHGLCVSHRGTGGARVRGPSRGVAAHPPGGARLERPPRGTCRDRTRRHGRAAGAWPASAPDRAGLEDGLEGSDLDWLITYALRRQLGAVARRESNGSLDPAQAGEELCIGFVDLSDFTVLSTRTELDAIGALLQTFESLAFDVVAETPGRVVKLIGDEVMFVCPRAETPPGRRCRSSTASPTSGFLRPGRAGRRPRSAPGRRHFGTPVNRASRITQVAAPGTVLVDDAVRAGLAGIDDLHVEPAGERRLKGLEQSRFTASRVGRPPDNGRPVSDDAHQVPANSERAIHQDYRLRCPAFGTLRAPSCGSAPPRRRAGYPCRSRTDESRPGTRRSDRVPSASPSGRRCRT